MESDRNKIFEDGDLLEGEELEELLDRVIPIRPILLDSDSVGDTTISHNGRTFTDIAGQLILPIDSANIDNL